jgi:hypothetical protein
LEEFAVRDRRRCAQASLTVVSPDLDGMNSGTIYLSVPLLDGVIQVGIGGDVATATIQVSKTLTTVTIRRTDGAPMQAQILHEHQGYAGPTVRTNVFRTPVNCLRLERRVSEGGLSLWFPAETVHVNRGQDLSRFVVTIARFGLAKQRQVSRC